MLHEVEHQDAVLGDDADADDGTQKRDDVQRRAGNPQREDGPEHRQHGSDDDGERLEDFDHGAAKVALFQPRGHGDVLSQLRDDLVGPAGTPRLELDQEIAGVGFGDQRRRPTWRAMASA
jgi:hypothetical protein